MTQPPARVRNFAETVAARARIDPAFAQALLDEAITLFVNGEPESAKLILRDLVNATVGFEALADEIHKPARSLHRMLSNSGNPAVSNVPAIFAAIKRAEGRGTRPGRDGPNRARGWRIEVDGHPSGIRQLRDGLQCVFGPEGARGLQSILAVALSHGRALHVDGALSGKLAPRPENHGPKISRLLRRRMLC